MSRFNTLYMGQAEEAADELERTDLPTTSPTTDELRLALINALRRIVVLEHNQTELMVRRRAPHQRRRTG